MKKLFSTVAALSIITAASSAAAATYQSTSTYTGSNWEMTWPAIDPKCNALEISNAAPYKEMIVIIDGNLGYFDSRSINPDSNMTKITLRNLPGGNQFSATANGKSFFVCGGDTYFLPGHAQPPAPVPTLSEWAMILLGVMLAGAASLTIHRLRTA